MPTDMPKFVLYAEPSLHAALIGDAAAHGREPNDHIMRVLIEYALKKGLFRQEDEHDFRLRLGLIDRAVDTARRFCREDRFNEHITRNVFAACMAEPRYAADYEAYVRGNPYAHGNPRKAVNKAIGQAIKAGIGGEVLKNDDGTPAKENVTGSVIQSYTKMASFDPKVVG